MGTKTAQIDSYIAKSAAFAQPILEYIRQLVHNVCPDVEETMKWSCPHFEYKGVICGMAAFKAHCVLKFWKGELILESAAVKTDSRIGQFGRLTQLSDLPSEQKLTAYLYKARELNEAGVKLLVPAQPKPEIKLIIPEALSKAFDANQLAYTTFENFPPSYKREYADWINDAKTEATRNKRVGIAIDWISEGKSRNWKYKNC